MKTQIIALEAHDDFISVRDRMSWAKSPRILLVWPKYEKITLRPADLRILQQHASYLGAEMGVITRRGEVRGDAQRFGIPVFSSAAEAQRKAWQHAGDPAATRRRTRRGRTALGAMRDAAKRREATWTSRPLTRFGAFFMGVLAVLALSALFVPQAQVSLTPISQQQSVIVPVTAGPDITTVSIAGNVPAHPVKVTVEARQSARITTQASLPAGKAKGIARFTNLTQTDVSIPAGTIVYSLSPAIIRFATLNDTHVAGNVNAVVEVPVASVDTGAAANLPANSIQAIEGGLSLLLAVTNPEPTEGGIDRMAAMPSDADRQRLHDVVAGLLNSQALAQMGDSLGSGDVLLAGTLKMGQILEEKYEPPVGEPGNLLTLSLRAEYEAQSVKAEDLRQLAEATLNAALPQGFTSSAGSLTLHVTGEPTLDEKGAAHFGLQLERRVVRELDLQHANALVRGLAPWQAANNLQAQLPLSTRPQVKLSPDWWPWMPLIPFRITVTSGQ
jgi:hypothetical protein